MLHYFNASLFAVALFDFALFIGVVALFTVAQSNVHYVNIALYYVPLF